MSQTTFAAIDVGSNEVSMKVYEVSKKNGIIELDQLRHTIELGSDTYRNGKISHSLVSELCNVLIGFKKKMKEYDVTDYSACATSAVREAQNHILILDQIKLNSGFTTRILSNSEQRFICYKAIALKEAHFNSMIQKGTAIVDVGAGSIQISLFNKEALLTTQNIKLGSLRIRELLSDMEHQTINYHHLISEYIDNDLQTFKELFLKKTKIKHIIGVGENLTNFVRFGYTSFQSRNHHTTSKKDCLLKNSEYQVDRIDRSNFYDFYKNLLQTSVDEISFSLGIPREQASLILPTAMIYYKMFEETSAEFMWLPGITLCDGLVADYAERKEKLIPSHDFTQDIIASARNIASRYYCNELHTLHVEHMALLLFDHMKKLHGLGKRERLLMQIAIILHNCGEFINMNACAENSYNIILSTEIIGLSHRERELIANLVRYDTDSFPKFSEFFIKNDKDVYMKLCKLTAILRIANALDKSHKQKFDTIHISFKKTELIMTAQTLKDITLEQGLIAKKADFFEEVYGLRPVLKQKRSI